ncbi:MAG: hypothetical protein JW750_09545 [Anaerolineaceae bacterium]|nr:hypothetical protein [Anaerolineaceae bacterium]
MNEQMKATHKQLAVELFNHTWDLMDKTDRTQEEVDEMIHSAHASRYHWQQVGTVLNLARGEWQISRVYALIGRGEPCAYHARRCLDLTLENQLGDFDRAFAYEAMARASALLNNEDAKARFLQLARESADEIVEQDDRDYFLSELKTLQD